MEVEEGEDVGKYNILPDGTILCGRCSHRQCECYKIEERCADDVEIWSEDSLKDGRESEDSDDLENNHRWMEENGYGRVGEREEDEYSHEEGVMTQRWLEDNCSPMIKDGESPSVILPDLIIDDEECGEGRGRGGSEGDDEGVNALKAILLESPLSKGKSYYTERSLDTADSDVEVNGAWESAVQTGENVEGVYEGGESEEEELPTQENLFQHNDEIICCCVNCISEIGQHGDCEMSTMILVRESPLVKIFPILLKDSCYVIHGEEITVDTNILIISKAYQRVSAKVVQIGDTVWHNLYNSSIFLTSGHINLSTTRRLTLKLDLKDRTLPSIFIPANTHIGNLEVSTCLT